MLVELGEPTDRALIAAAASKSGGAQILFALVFLLLALTTLTLLSSKQRVERVDVVTSAVSGG